MIFDPFPERQFIVFCSGIFYWGAVVVKTLQVRRKTRHMPSVTPRSTKEWVLWFGWASVVSGWIGQPWILVHNADQKLFLFSKILQYPHWGFTGILLIVLGFCGTFWSHHALGNAWSIAIDKHGRQPLVKTGPYHYVRHPIYTFQFMILGGAALVLPNLFSLLLLAIHAICVWFKSLDEEVYLAGLHGESWREYARKTGRYTAFWKGQSI